METLPHLLVVDDDSRLRELMRDYLKEHGYVVATAPGASHARSLMEALSFDLMVLDVMMPGESGLDFLAGMRSAGNIPVLMLTALGEASDRIAGFEKGADDYLPKPFEPKEMVLRIEAILRRTRKKKPTLKIGGFVFDPVTQALSKSTGESVYLTGGEAKLLSALARTPNSELSREELAKISGNVSERAVDVQITRLRKKLEDDPRKPSAIQTVRGSGYVLRIS